MDFDYLQAKLTATDLNALIADYDYLPEDKDSQEVQSAIRLSAHVLARDRRQLAGQLIGRLLDDKTPSIQILQKQGVARKAWPSLRPIHANLAPAGGPLLRTFQGHTNAVVALSVTPDGRHVVCGSADNTLGVWDLATGEIKTTLQGHTGWVTAVAVTPDGRHVVSGSADKTLRIWDLATGETKTTLTGHTDSVLAVAVTPDGRRLISGSHDHTLRVWNVTDAKEIVTFIVDAAVTACIAAQDNGTILAADHFGRLHFFEFVEADPTKPAIGELKIPLLQCQGQARSATDS